MRPTILVVEDEEPIRAGLCDVLAFHGYSPTPAADGDLGLRAALDRAFDLLILDVMLPGVDGLTICRRAREARPRQAILMLTARGDEASILEGFRCGADDYMAKPFSVAQLSARVQALLRRSGARPPRRFKLGDLEVDGDGLRALGPGGEADLSPRDVEVLAYLADQGERIVPRAELLQQVWGYARVNSVETRCIDMHVAKLRRKLQAATAAEVIQTVRGAGYRRGAGE